jgi:CheY-like chemotaxis protein/anti-sigma regulatory factor (Ser/Thr protein kinase)
MSHDIRTPMTAIIGLSELMPTDNMNRTQQEYLEDIKRMSRMLLDLINDILDFSKVEAGKMELVPVHYDLRTLHDDICSIARTMVVDKPLCIKSDFDGDLPATLLGDEVRVRQIVMNLVHNAIKYTPRGHVAIRFRKAAQNGCDYLSIAVEDTGIGIRQKDFLRMFEAFEQLDRNKNKEIPGTGLGLAITKRLVELMQGEISLTSEYGRGSTFTVLLPLVEGDTGKTGNGRSPEHCLVSPQARILVVDDNAVNLTVALGFLAKHGVRADTAASGEEAITKIRRTIYDLVFMDHLMPGMDGIETVRHIRLLGGEYAAMPIVALSANAVLNVRDAFFQAGMNDFIAKPINGEDMNRVLARWLPPEMILGEKRTGDDEAAEAARNTLLPLTAISDLDVRAGLARSAGNTAVYVDILCRFCRDLDRDAADILALAENAAWRDYAVRLHALKNVFANFGSRRLSALALRLEQDATAGNTAACLAGTREFCAEMERFRARLLETPLLELEAGFKTTIDPQELIRQLEELQQACRARDVRAAAAATRTLQNIACGNAQADALLAQICDLVDLVEYAEVIGKCDDLAALLGGKRALPPQTLPAGE